MRVPAATLFGTPFGLSLLTWPVGAFLGKAGGMSLGNVVYVGITGSDETGDGSFDAPFATISFALESITSATPANPYVIIVGPGTYTEDVAIKPSVSVVAIDPTEISCIINGDVSLDASWTASSNAESAFFGFSISDDVVLDFASVSLTTGFIIFSNCAIDGVVTATGVAPGLANAVGFDLCLVAGGITATGIELSSSETLFGSVTLISTDTLQVQWSSSGDQSFAIVELTAATQPCGAALIGTAVQGPLILNGANTSYATSVEGIPVTVTLTGGASGPVLTTLSAGVDYSPGVPGNWAGTPPSTVQEAFDRIAANTSNAHPIP